MEVRDYVCTIVHGGGFGGGAGGTYSDEFAYRSEHRAGSKANAQDAVR